MYNSAYTSISRLVMKGNYPVLESLILNFTKLEEVDLSSTSMENIREINLSYSSLRTLKFPKVFAYLHTINLRILHPNTRVQFLDGAQFNQRTEYRA
jgi:hypothetical protein